MKRVEEVLGRAIDDSAFHSIPTLNDAPSFVIEDVRRLVPDGILINSYLRFYVARYKLNHYEGFVKDVVLGGADPSAWGFRDVFVHLEEPDRRFCLGIDWNVVRERFAATEGARWWRARFSTIANTEASWSGWGAIGMRIDHVPYWWRTPDGMMDSLCADETGPLVEHIDEDAAPLALRRWIAFRLGWWAKDYLKAAGPAATVEGILAAVGARSAEVSADGRIALHAFVRECALGFDPAHQVRGFVGPDEWYRGAGA
jgi:hypothetical protein